MIPGLELYACGVMLSRLVYLPNDGPLPMRKSSVLALSQLLVLFFVYPWQSAVWWTGAVLMIISLVAYQFENAARIRLGIRVFTLLLQQTKDRQFSEYMLIGTLASTIFAVIIALVLQPFSIN